MTLKLIGGLGVGMNVGVSLSIQGGSEGCVEPAGEATHGGGVVWAAGGGCALALSGGASVELVAMIGQRARGLRPLTNVAQLRGAAPPATPGLRRA